MIVLSHRAPPARRWLAHLLRAGEGSIRRGDPFDDDLPFEDEAVLRLALRHGVAPLIHRTLVDGRVADPVPEAFQKSCERAYYAALRKNLIALEAGRTVLDALEEMGVPSAPLGGWALLHEPAAHYLDPGTRPLGDLELIVSPGDRACAEAVLSDLGFRRVPLRAAAARGRGAGMAFHRRISASDLFLEVRWAHVDPDGPARGLAVAGDRFLEAFCEPVKAGVLRLTRTAELLFVASHVARRDLEPWISLVDLHRTASRGRVDWNDVLRTARLWRVCRPVYVGLRAARELLRTSIPCEVLDALAPGPVRRRLLHRSLAVSAREGGSRRAAWTAKLLLGESWWEVARTVARAGVSPAERAAETSKLPSRRPRPLRLLRASRDPRPAAQRLRRTRSHRGVPARPPFPSKLFSIGTGRSASHARPPQPPR